MKALIKRSRTPRDLKLCEIDMPRLAPDRMIARVAYAGICQSDLDILEDRTALYQPPVVPGHEFSAVVEEVGAEVEGFRPGDRVTSETPFEVCGTCQSCRDGFYEV